MGKQWETIFLGSKITAVMKLNDACSLEEKLSRHHIKKQTHYFADKGPSSQSYGFPSSRVWIWKLNYKESWAPKNWCSWTAVLEKTLESPLDSKKIKPVNPKGKQPWIFIKRTEAEAKTPVLCPLDGKSWLIGKDPDVEKDWKQEEKRTTEDEMVGWHHQLDRHEFQQSPGVGEGQGSLVCCSPRGLKESTQLSDWTRTTTVTLAWYPELIPSSWGRESVFP